MNPNLQAILAAIAAFVLVLIILSFIIFICRPARKEARTRNRARHPNRHHRVREIDSSHRELSSITTGESATFDPSLDEISMEELLMATENFSSDLIVGDGSFGLVYRARLSNGTIVAVKKLDPDAFQGFREFRAEMETLSKLRHTNIVKILGYCVSGMDRVLIYEFIEKGSLDQWLHVTSSNDDVSSKRFTIGPLYPLTWDTRLKIMKGVANGLAYLHGLEKAIIHRDIKASNILLDSDFEAHIADFGLARRMNSSHSHVSTQIAGTMGYMPPEYREGNTAARVTTDVYSFGILMVEVVTQRRPNLPVRFDGKDIGLAQWTTKMVENERYMEMVDPSAIEDGLSEVSVKEYFRIACNCIQDRSKERPQMKEVVHLLSRV